MSEKKPTPATENRPATKKAARPTAANPADFGKPDSAVRERMARNIKANQEGKPVDRDRAR